ncbi:MAG: hypothetical protein LVQ94_05955, partial [Thermoplasmatales archaeon]|nr:hypothetical protein [Thermoplasmatales archaeon]
ISKDMGISRLTVRRYLKGKKPPEYSKKNRVSKLESYKAYIKERIDRYNLSAVRILEEIRKKGYKGGYSTLKYYCATLRKDHAITAVIRFRLIAVYCLNSTITAQFPTEPLDSCV